MPNGNRRRNATRRRSRPSSTTRRSRSSSATRRRSHNRKEGMAYANILAERKAYEKVHGVGSYNRNLNSNQGLKPF